MGNAYIVGFMGTGKSSAGAIAAKELGCAFIDLDARIAAAQGKSIADIFAVEGEDAFRRFETAALQEVASGRAAVVACGGGIVTREENIACMRTSGVIICLTASAEAIYARVRNDTTRPLLNVADPRARIEQLLRARAASYAQAAVTIDTTLLSVEEVAARIVACARPLIR